MQRLQFFTNASKGKPNLLDLVNELHSLAQQLSTKTDKTEFAAKLIGKEKWRLHIRSIHPTLDSLTLSGIKHHGYKDRNELSSMRQNSYPYNQKSIVVTFCHKNGEKEHYIIRDLQFTCLYIRLMWQFAVLYQKTEFYSKPADQHSEQFNQYMDEYWSEFNDIQELIAYYDRINDAAILDILNVKIDSLKELGQPDNQLVIADLGAGNGRLAKKIIDLISPHIPVHYIFLEPNKIEFESAKSMLANYHQNKQCKITWLNIPFEQIQNDLSAHCVISSGGPLNFQIVPTHEAAKQNLLRMKALLVTNGLLISTGISENYINAHQFEKNGFDVLSYAANIPIPEDMSDYLKDETKFNMRYYPFVQRYVCVNQNQISFEPPSNAIRHN